MILYYNNPEAEGEQTDIYVDFYSIHQKVKKNFTESSLYRLLRKRCSHAVRYQNRDLYLYSDILNIPELVKEFKKNG